MFRMLRVLKNRFGPNQELLIFRMVRKGLELVEDPSTFFLGARDTSLSGTAVVMAVDGQRPLAVEIQALATRSYLAIPRRTGLGFDVNRLHLLLAVLEKRLHMVGTVLCGWEGVKGLSGKAVFPLRDEDLFPLGSTKLNGQVRPVSGQDVRMKQALRLGYSPIICPENPKSKGIATVADLQRILFRKG